MKRASVRDHVSSILVAALSSAFGVLLLEVTSALNVMIAVDDVANHISTPILLTIAVYVFMSIAVYVGAIVTTNTFATIIAGRTRTIALMRLIGSSARAERRAVTREGTIVGVLGSLLGLFTGIGLSWIIINVAVFAKIVPNLAYSFWRPDLLVPVVIVVLTTWMSSWVGSRRVLQVTPLQAVGAAQERTQEETTSGKRRSGVAIALMVIGTAFLVLGIFVGLIKIEGVLIGLVGGILSFTGLVLGAHIVMPPALRFAGRLMGTRAEAILASENAVRYPERSSRMTIGLVIGVTLITMFSVAVQTFQDMVRRAAYYDATKYGDLDQITAITVTVFSILIGVSALIAGVGMVNNMSLSVVQRQRELGLLRALGFSGAQVRRMITLEAAQYTLAALVVGLPLGVLYGWGGAQSMLGSADGVGQVLPPGIPWIVVAAVVAASAVLTVSASVAPARRATRVAPVVALAAD